MTERKRAQFLKMVKKKSVGTVGGRLLIILFVFALAGCSPRIQHYVDQSLDLGFVQKVAVLPLENNTDNEFAHERVQSILITAKYIQM